jgi:hypothetical protein
MAAAALDQATEADIQDKSVAFRISQLLRYSVLPLRWEPLNYVAEHRGVATAGGLFGTDTYLIGNHRGQRRIFLLSPHEQKLLDQGPARQSDKDADVEIVVVARLGRLTPGYADFALCLAGLEGGMILAQFILQAKRLDLDLLGDGSASRFQAQLQLRSSDLPLFSLAIHTYGVSPFDRMHDAIVAAIIPIDAVADFSRLPALQKLLQIGAAPSEELPNYEHSKTPFPASLKLFDATLKRSSGRTDIVGSAKSGLLMSEVESLVRCAFEYRGQIPVSVPDANIVSSLAICDSNGDIALFTLTSGENNLVEQLLSPDAEAAVRDACSGDFNIVITIGVATISMVEMISSGQLFRLYAAAGTLGQCIGLAAAQMGAVARPYRAMQDSLMNLLLPFEARGLLQILIGYERKPNPAFPF